MRNEAIWLVQLLVSMSIVAAAFGVGVWTGRRPAPATWESLDAEVEVRAATGRRDLFAPEVDLRELAAPTDAAPRELTRGS